MAEVELSVVLGDLALPSCPRWRDGSLWFSDVVDGRIVNVAEDGTVRASHEVPGRPGGIGWMPDGSLLVVSIGERRIYRLDGDALVEHADVWDLSPHDCNEMLVTSSGIAYVSNAGFDYIAGAEPRSTTLVGVDPDGTTWLAAEGLLLPNGLAMSPDGGTLYVAESLGRRVTAFTVGTNGELSSGRVFADLQPNVPGGICVDGEGAVWAADPVNKGVMRIIEGIGAVAWVSAGDRRAYSCALGGDDGHVLFACTAATSEPTRAAELRSGRIEAAPVEVPAASSLIA